MIVTNHKWKSRYGETRIGFYMDGYEVENLLGVTKYLKKAKDIVGIITGHGKTRIGKSTHASQIAYFIAWLLAGGKLILGVDENGKRIIKEQINPIRPVRFSLKENYAFSPDALMAVSERLFNKYGKNQVIVYDEARGGLASDRAMESINKTMSEWFEQCGQFGHIILLVLPNFFKLHEDYAVARSLFLIDVFEDKNYNKGFFNFYNELQKERLYYFGKKLVGVTARYSAANESFWGRFSDFVPFDKEEYELLKRKAIKSLKRTRYEKKFIKRFYACLFVLKKFTTMTDMEISKELSVICGELISERMVRYALTAISHSKVEE